MKDQDREMATGEIVTQSVGLSKLIEDDSQTSIYVQKLKGDLLKTEPYLLYFCTTEMDQDLTVLPTTQCPLFAFCL